jgi:hypothetical protein
MSTPVVAKPLLPLVGVTPIDETSFNSGPAEVPASGEPTPDIAVAAVPAESASAGSRVSWTVVLVAVWLAGSLWWFLLAAVRLLRFQRLVRRAGTSPGGGTAAGRAVWLAAVSGGPGGGGADPPSAVAPRATCRRLAARRPASSIGPLGADGSCGP